MDPHRVDITSFYRNTNKIYDLEQLKRFLQTYQLTQYFQTFVAEGFDRLLSLFDITESDLISLNVKRGHRRLLQRAIATARGIPISAPLFIYYKKKARHTQHRTTAYKEFSNRVKQDVGDTDHSDIHSTITKGWNKLSIKEKEKYEQEALLKNRYYG